MKRLESGSGCRRASLAFLAALLGVAGLVTRPPAAAAAKEDIVLALKDKEIRNLSSAGLTLVFGIGVDNKSSTGRELVRYRLRFTVGQREFLNMDVGLDEPIAVPAGRETLVALPVKITYALLFQAVGPIEDKALCDLVGDMIFADARKREDKVSFAYPAEFPIFRDPEIECLPLKVNDLTVGGADVVFRPRFANPNRYELLIERISYRLYFGSTLVDEGLVPGDKAVPAAGEKAFSLPFILDFFEAGDEIREDFKKPAFACRFAGEITISSVWGPLMVRFDKNLNLAVQKPG